MTADAVPEILTQPERRRRWTSEQKLALVGETLRPGASMTQIARRYGISTGLLYTWRRLAQNGELSLASTAPMPRFVPVESVREAPTAADGAVRLTAAQLSMLLEGIDWRAPLRTWRPEVAG